MKSEDDTFRLLSRVTFDEIALARRIHVAEYLSATGRKAAEYNSKYESRMKRS